MLFICGFKRIDKTMKNLQGKIEPSNPKCPRKVLPFEPLPVVSKPVVDMKDYEIDYLLAKHAGQLAIIQDWNGIFCKTVSESPGQTCINDEASWIIGIDLKINSIYQPSQRLNEKLLSDYLISLNKENGLFHLTIGCDGNKVTHSGVNIAKTLSRALVTLFYGKEAEVMLPMRNYYFDKNYDIPGRKLQGITEDEFWCG